MGIIPSVFQLTVLTFTYNEIVFGMSFLVKSLICLWKIVTRIIPKSKMTLIIIGYFQRKTYFF